MMRALGWLLAGAVVLAGLTLAATGEYSVPATPVPLVDSIRGGGK